jgi:hypothetical protein
MDKHLLALQAVMFLKTENCLNGKRILFSRTVLIICSIAEFKVFNDLNRSYWNFDFKDTLLNKQRLYPGLHMLNEL